MDRKHRGRHYCGLVAGMSISSAGFATVGACGDVTGVSVSVLLGVRPALLEVLAPDPGGLEVEPDDPVAPDVVEVLLDCVPDAGGASVLAGAVAAGALRLSTLLVAVLPQPSGTATALVRTVAGERLPALSSVRTR